MNTFYEDFKRPIDRVVKYVGPIAMIIFVAYVFISNNTYEKKVIKLAFDGIVENVSYDGKSIPSVTIKSVKYYLGSNYWNFERQIAVGDSMQKDSGRYLVKLIKQNSGKIMIFDKE